MSSAHPLFAPLVAVAVGLGAAVVVVSTTACGPEPEVEFGNPEALNPSKAPSGRAPSSSSGGTSEDGGVDDGDLFGNLDPPAPTKTATEAHAAKVGVAPPMSNKLDCLAAGCHSGTPAAGAPPAFAFGGWVNKGGTGIKDAIIVVKDGANRVGAKSDADGYFWAVGPRMTKGLTGAKSPDGKPQEMGTELSEANDNGNCNTSRCHAGPQLPVYVL